MKKKTFALVALVAITSLLAATQAEARGFGGRGGGFRGASISRSSSAVKVSRPAPVVRKTAPAPVVTQTNSSSGSWFGPAMAGWFIGSSMGSSSANATTTSKTTVEEKKAK